MKEGLYAFRDEGYISDIGMGEQGLEALLIVYRNVSGRTGLGSDKFSLRLSEKILEDAITVKKSGEIISYFPGGNFETFVNFVVGNTGISVHSADHTVLEEARALMSFQAACKLNATYAKFGKEKKLPPVPWIKDLDIKSEDFKKSVKKALVNCKNICVWNRFTEYGISPTFISYDGNSPIDFIRMICSDENIPFHLVLDIKDLPSW